MVQNPHPPRARPMARSTILPAALPTVPHGVSRSLPTVLPAVPHGVSHSPPHRASRGFPLSSLSRGGNCVNRDATRRRHAVAMRLMVQNPHPPRARPMARSTILPIALPAVPHGVPRSPPHRAPHRAPRGSPLSSPPCSPQPSTGEGAAPGCAPASSIIRGISRKYLTCVGRG